MVGGTAMCHAKLSGGRIGRDDQINGRDDWAKAVVPRMGTSCSGQSLGRQHCSTGDSERKGCGTLRHINVGLLWVQEKKPRDIIEFKKLEGQVNPADLMAKHVGPATLSDPCRIFNTALGQGRAKASLAAKV